MSIHRQIKPDQSDGPGSVALQAHGQKIVRRNERPPYGLPRLCWMITTIGRGRNGANLANSSSER